MLMGSKLFMAFLIAGILHSWQYEETIAQVRRLNDSVFDT